ncbi:MAG: Wzz/FepE/Etk N-terminal domain-containing protein [Methylococcus sp.]|nr:Wzz/FepE/Etk N-terminal domain-containing protein [Methylococcus sp.]
MNDNSNSGHHGLVPYPPIHHSTGTGDAAVSLQDDTIDILPYWNRVRRNLLLILGVAALVSLGTYGVLAKRTPVYQATATLLIEPQHRKMVAFKEPDEAESPDDTYYPTEIERLKFKSLARRVIDELHLAQYPEFGGQLEGSGSLAQDTAQQAADPADANGGASRQNSRSPQEEEQSSADMAAQLSTDDLIGLFLSRLTGSESHGALCLTAFPTPHDRACETVIAFGAWAVLRSLARRQQGPLASFHNDFTAFPDALQSTSGQR